MAQQSYQEIILSADTVYAWPNSFEDVPTVADLNNVSPTSGGFKIILPDATLNSDGQTLRFNNISIFSFDLAPNDGLSTLVTIAAGEAYLIYLTDTSTANGIWSILPYGGGTSAINFVEAESTDGSIVIDNPILVPPGGTIDFKLPTGISNLNNVATTGFAVVTTAAPLTWSTSTLIAGENITITNPDGVASDPILDVNPVLTSITSASIGELTITGGLITTNVVNGGLQITSAGTGTVSINGIEIDTSANITGINNLEMTGTFNNAGISRAFCVFTDISSIIVIEDSNNVDNVTGSAGTYTINFTAPMANINYGVQISLGTSGGALPFVSNGYVTTKALGAVTIVITDASGELVTDVPYGATISILSSAS